MSRYDCEIAVVGGGVNGTAAALALHRAGFDVRLIDREAGPLAFDEATFDSRVYAVSPSSARFLDQCGLWSAIRSRRAAAYERMRVWEDAPEQGLVFDAAEAGTACLGWIVEQSLILEALWSAVPPECRMPNRQVDGLLPGDGHARLRFADGETLTARLVVAAEGGHSRLRDLAGIETRGWSYGQTALVCHVETSRAHEGVALQRFLPEGPLAFLPLPDGRRSIVWSTGFEQARGMLELDAEAFRLQLSEAIQFETGLVHGTTKPVLFPLRMMHAKRYAVPSLVLLGDAAHVVHPLAGQGANLGLADTACLVEKLVEARRAGRDWSSLRVLRAYERQRRVANTEMLALTDLLNRSFRSRLPGVRELLNAGLGMVDRTGPFKQWLVRRALG